MEVIGSIAISRRLTDHSGTSVLTCTGLKRWKRSKRSSRTGGGTTTRVGLTRLSMTCRRLNLYAGRGFQVTSQLNQRRKLTLGMVLETQTDHSQPAICIKWYGLSGQGHFRAPLPSPCPRLCFCPGSVPPPVLPRLSAPAA